MIKSYCTTSKIGQLRLSLLHSCLLLCWRTEEQSAFEKLSANIRQTEHGSTFVINFNEENQFSFSCQADGIKSQHSSKPSTLGGIVGRVSGQEISLTK
jgi:hypothetical protein